MRTISAKIIYEKKITIGGFFMQKTICGKIYDTETAKFVKKNTFGVYGDPTGYEEVLFETPEGLFFLYTNGGSASKYPKEDIKRVSKVNASKF